MVVLCVLIWWGIGASVSVIAIVLNRNALNRRYPTVAEHHFTVGDAVFAFIGGIGGLITLGSLCLVGSVVLFTKAIDAIDDMDKPLFKRKDIEKSREPRRNG